MRRRNRKQDQLDIDNTEVPLPKRRQLGEASPTHNIGSIDKKDAIAVIEELFSSPLTSIVHGAG